LKAGDRRKKLVDEKIFRERNLLHTEEEKTGWKLEIQGRRW
jgi:hypothetical protein